MGSTNIIRQKSLLNLKYIMLLVSFVLTGLIMKLLSPPGKLDSTFFYSYTYAVDFFTQLTIEQSTRYFLAELFDLWYLINYTLILRLLFQKFDILSRHPWVIFLPGLLDIMENGLIIYYLKTSQLGVLHQALPVVSAIKWLIGFFLLALLLLKILARFRKA